MPNTARYAQNNDNTGRCLTLSYLTPAYAATLAISPNASSTTINPGTLTGAMTVNATVTNSYADDTVTFMFTADATARIVTFGTNFVSAGTLTAAISKKATISFRFDGTSFVEISRFVQP